MNFSSTPYSPINNHLQYGNMNNRPKAQLIVPYVNNFITSTIELNLLDDLDKVDFLEWIEERAVMLALDSFFIGSGYFVGDEYRTNGVRIMDGILEDLYNSIPGDIENAVQALNERCLYEWLFIEEVTNGSSSFYNYCVSVEQSAINMIKHISQYIAMLGEDVVQFIHVEKLPDNTGYYVLLEF